MALPVWDVGGQHLALQCCKAAREPQLSCRRPPPGTGWQQSPGRAGEQAEGTHPGEKAQRGLSSGPYLPGGAQGAPALTHPLPLRTALPCPHHPRSSVRVSHGGWGRGTEMGSWGGSRSQTPRSRLQAPVQVAFSRPLSLTQQIQRENNEKCQDSDSRASIPKRGPSCSRPLAGGLVGWDSTQDVIWRKQRKTPQLKGFPT